MHTRKDLMNERDTQCTASARQLVRSYCIYYIILLPAVKKQNMYAYPEIKCLRARSPVEFGKIKIRVFRFFRLLCTSTFIFHKFVIMIKWNVVCGLAPRTREILYRKPALSFPFVFVFMYSYLNVIAAAARKQDVLCIEFPSKYMKTMIIVARLHQGRIWVETKGRGAKLIFLLYNL